MSLKKDIVVLESYNPIWKDMYEKEEIKLKELLDNNIISVMHVGSTSIEGLSAKPVIDIMVTVNTLSEVEKFKNLFKLEDGYDFRDDNGEKGEYLVRKGSEDARTHFIHIIEDKSVRYYNFTKFKTYLSNHPESVKAYEDLKKKLSIEYSGDRKSYTASKNDFIQNILRLYDLEEK
ncbi:MAG: GrpB family protein [Bacilli bacterium]